MGNSKNYRKAFKMTAAIMAAVFLWNQISWAAELAENTLQRLNESQAQLFAPAYLQSQESVQVGLIDQKQAIEDAMNVQYLVTSSNITAPVPETVDLKGPIGGGSQVSVSTMPDGVIDPLAAASGTEFSVTTQAGDVIRYVNGMIDRIERRDGTTLRNVTLDQNNALLGAGIEYADGTTQIVENGKLIRALTPNGAIVNYNAEERIDSVVYPGGATVTYTYIKDTAGTIQGIITTDGEKTSYYTAAGVIEKAEYISGKKLEYEDGVLASLKKEDGSRYIFKKNISGDNITITLGTYIAADGWTFVLNDIGIISSVTSPTGAAMHYDSGSPILSRNGNVLISYSSDGSAKYIVEGRQGITAAYIDPSSGIIIVPLLIIDSLCDAIARLPEASRTRVAAEQIMLEKGLILDTAVSSLNRASEIYASALQDLNTAIGQRQAAEARLTISISESLVGYNVSAEAIAIVTDKTPIDEKCLSYRSSVWLKPSDEYVKFTNGEILLQGTGISNVAKIFARSRWQCPGISTLSFDFKVDSPSGSFTASFDNLTSSTAESGLSIVVKDGAVKVELSGLSSRAYVATLISAVKIDTYYTCAFDVSNDGIRIYVWERSTQRPIAPSYTFTGLKSFCKPSFSVYSGKAWVDNVKVQSKTITRSYDAAGRILSQDINDGVVTTYRYIFSEQNAILYWLKTIREKFDSTMPARWMVVPGTSAAQTSGSVKLTGTGINNNSRIRSSSYQAASSLPIYEIRFSVDSLNSDLDLGVETSPGQKISIIARNGRIDAFYSGASGAVVTPIKELKTNAFYRARFERMQDGSVNVYVWEDGSAIGQAVNIKGLSYSSSARFSASVKNGIVTLDDYTLSQRFNPSVISTNSSAARLKTALDIEAAKKAVFDPVKDAYDRLAAEEPLARSDYDIAKASYDAVCAVESPLADAKEAAENVFSDLLTLFNNSAAEPYLSVYSDSRYFQDVVSRPEAIKPFLDFTRVVYSANRAGVPKEIVTSADGVISFDDKGVAINQNGETVARYSYLSAGSGILKGVTTTSEGIGRFYDIKGKLKAIISADGTRIEYDGIDVASIAYADGTTLLYTGGRLDEAIDRNGTRFTLNSNGKPVQAVDKHGNIYNYSYPADTGDNTVVTIVEDSGNGQKRRYENGLLVRTEGANGFISENIYYSDGRLEEAIVTRAGRTLNKYSYAYSPNGETLVRDINGDVRTYGVDGKLAALADPIGNVYQYSYPDSVTMRVELVKYITPTADDLVITQELINGRLWKAYKANGTVITYNAAGNIERISDAVGKTLVSYFYDDAGDLTDISMYGARGDLAGAISIAKSKIEEEKAKAILAVETQKNAALKNLGINLTLSETQELSALMSRYRALIDQLSALTGGVVSPYSSNPMTAADFIKTLSSSDPRIAQINSAVNEMNQVKSRIDYLREKGFGPRDRVVQEAAIAKSKIEAQANLELAKITAEGDRLLSEIIKQEAAPLVLNYYRSLLGRDPDACETSAWLSKVSVGQQKLNKNDIIEAIIVSNEYSARRSSVADIKLKVRQTLEAYLTAASSTEGRSVFLSKLGLSENDTVDISRYDVDTILKWLDSQNLHFGYSAFLSLKDLLASSGIQCDFEELAVNVILIDILTGATDIFTNGDLELSMYAMSKYAQTKGLSLYNTRLTFEDLKSRLALDGEVIAHIDGNHYITVTGIEADKIYYKEKNRGQYGTEEMILKEDFLKKWSGYTITKTPPQDSARILSNAEAKKIKGSFFFIIAWVIGAVVAAVTTVVATVVSAVAAAVAAVASIVAGVVSAISVAASQIISGISAVFSGIASMTSGVIGTSFAGAALKTVAGIGLNLGIQAGLQALGVNSTISGITSAFLTGGILSFFNPIAGASMLGSFMSEGLKYATISGINELAPRLNLDSSISGILSIIGGTLVDGFWQGDIAGKLIKIAPNIAGEFAYYGVTKLGVELGIDSSISYLAGIGIRSSLQAGLSSNMDPKAIWGSIVNGLARGGTSIGLQWAYEELDMDPILGSLSAAALTGAIEGLLEGQGATKGAYDTLFKAGAGLLTLGGSGNNAWARAAYISQVLDFSRIIRERGIVNALETYASGFLHQSAIDNIWKMGGIADLVTNKAEVTVNEEGLTVKRVYINPERTDFIDFSLDMDDMIGYKQGNILVDCPIEIGPDGRPTTANGKVKVLLEGKSRIVYNIKDHDLVLIEYIDLNGRTIAFAQPLEGEKSIRMNEDNNAIRTGRFYNIEKQIIVDKRDNRVFRILSTPKSDMTEAELQRLLTNGVEGEYLDGVTIEYDKSSNLIKVEINPDAQRIGEFEGKTTFLSLISVNGISSDFGQYAAPTYEERLKYRLSSQGVDENAIYLLPMFEGYGLPMSVRTVKDIGLWALDNAGTDILTSELIAKLDREIYGHILPGQQSEPKVMTLFSGSANPFFKAINKRHDFVIRDAIILGGPTLDGMFEDTTITNPNLDRIFNICGTKDVLYPVVSNKKYSSNVTPYNIEILGATHSDYFYNPAGSALNARSSYFVEKLMARVYTNGDVQGFLIGAGITYDSVNRKYVVDPYAIDYNPGFEWRNGE